MRGRWLDVLPMTLSSCSAFYSATLLELLADCRECVRGALERFEQRFVSTLPSLTARHARFYLIDTRQRKPFGQVPRFE